MGFKRHLSSGEIVAQVMYYARMLKEENQAVTNIVLMGMGEPFHNYDNTMSAIDRLNDTGGYNFGARRFTISTVGLVPQIRRFADEKRQVNLAISLHAADDNERLAIMPVTSCETACVTIERLDVSCKCHSPQPYYWLCGHGYRPSAGDYVQRIAGAGWGPVYDPHASRDRYPGRVWSTCRAVFVLTLFLYLKMVM